MKPICNNSATYFLFFFFSFLLTADVIAQQQNNHKIQPSRTKIDEKKFILINGIEQWVTIKGEQSKPIILFLHGGPGSPLSPYADNLYSELEKEFILVHWDQRGAGRTYGRNAPLEQTPAYFKSTILTLTQLTADGIALSEYLLKHLGKNKIILFGTSWGSVLGVEMASQRPDLYAAYVGHSQVVSPAQNFIETYHKLTAMAKTSNDVEASEILKTLGPPPYSSARTTGKLFRLIKKYERKTESPAPPSWFIPSPDYDNPKDEQHREEGDNYSFLNAAGDSEFEIPSILAPINFIADRINFLIPVYLIQGETDILTPKESTTAFFNAIKAPKKEYVLVPQSAHGFNQNILEAQIKIFRRIAN